jgi:hypothetical protein
VKCNVSQNVSKEYSSHTESPALEALIRVKGPSTHGFCAVLILLVKCRQTFTAQEVNQGNYNRYEVSVGYLMLALSDLEKAQHVTN